jgi:Xaa-Pro aminopeptidase
MKTDLDRIMQENNIDVLFITGAAQHNPPMVYFTGTCHVSAGELIKKRGSEPILFHYPMEREEAMRTGLKTVNYNDFSMSALMKEANGDYNEAIALRYKKAFEKAGVTSGRAAVYGNSDVSATYAILKHLERLLPEVKFEGFLNDEILLAARMTKDADEIAHIRAMGKITTDVVGRVADFLTGHKVKDETLVHPDGSPVTVAEVKSNINLWLAEKGAENPEGTIFSIGRDAGIPHSVGTDSDPMRLGQTIIFDIYPCEAQGGYFYDFTRTWCLGYAPDPVHKLYEEVHSVYDKITSELKVGTPFSVYQKRTCELYEAMGHPTPLNTPQTEIGYCHSLGHGIGLNVHEKPFSGMLNASPNDNLVPGTVFTLEPGLYYPDKGMGVRIEDSLYTTPDGKFEILAEFPKELVLSVKG